MKFTKKKILAVILAAALVIAMAAMAACSMIGGGTAYTQSDAAGSTASASSVMLSASSKTVTDDLADGAFSKRDLSGEYDTDEAFTIDLSAYNGSDVVISEAGTYILTGSLANGSVIVDATNEDKIQLVLNGVEISSSSYAAIYVKKADKVFITLAEGTENKLSNGGSFVQTDENNVDGAIFSKDDLTINGEGSLTIVSPAGHGIVCKDELVITGGVIDITAGEHAVQAKDSIAISGGSITLNAQKDGLHAENDEDDSLGYIWIGGGTLNVTASDDAVHGTSFVQIDGGTITVSGAEGIEGTYIQIGGGEITVTGTDDGLNGANKSSAYETAIEIAGGTLNVTVGQGDTDAVDSNGNLYVTGGTIYITSQMSSFDYDGTATYTGGTITVNGQTVNSITTSMMGGGMQMGGRR